MAESPLTSAGVLIGHDAYGASFVYDPWTLYEAGHVTGPNMVVVGIIGRGKSALLKSYLYRQRVFGREAWVVDPKGEFRALAKAFGCEPISLRPGGEMRLNPLTRRGGSHGQQSLLRSVAQAALARPLKPEEDAGLRVALARADRDALPAEPTLPDVVEALLKPDADMARTLVTSEAELAAGCREAALALQRLCEGDLRGMFDGQTSSGIDLDASWAYSDSASDLPMLELVGNPVAVAFDAELRAIAAERGWPTLRVERAAGACAVAGALLAALAGAGGWAAGRC